MASMKELIDGVIKVSNIAALVIPQAKLVGQVANMGGQLINILDGLKAEATPEQQPQMQEARKKLSAAVTAKAKSVSDSLR